MNQNSPSSREPRTTIAPGQDGFTLLELALVMVILSVVLGGVAGVVFRTNLFSGDYSREMVINQTAWRLMDRLSDEIRGADPSSVNPLAMDDSNWISFRQVEGYASGALVLSSVLTYSYQVVPGETLNGADDNGDGRIDEGVINYGDASPPPTTIGIAGNILGLRFNDIANGIEFSVDIGLVDRDGNLVSKTFTRKVTFRN